MIEITPAARERIQSLVEAEVVRTSYGTVSVDARINNVFNTVLNEDYLSTTQPYQLGRNAWVSVKFRY